MSRARLACVVASALWLAAPARAQEFATPAPATLGAEAMLERGLPDPGGALALAALHVRRPLGLTTRTLAASAGFRALRLAGGLSRSGDEALGWSAAAGALGIALGDAGLALRGVARRDEGAPAGEPLDGYEAGGGAWLRSAALTAWISAPQVWLAGAAPPLARGLSAGAEVAAGGALAGLAREAPRRGIAEPAAWSARLGLDLGALAVWGECREHPWRGGIGVSGAVGPVRCATQVDAHPVLEPTLRLALSVGVSGAAP